MLTFKNDDKLLPGGKRVAPHLVGVRGHTVGQNVTQGCNQITATRRDTQDPSQQTHGSSNRQLKGQFRNVREQGAGLELLRKVHVLPAARGLLICSHTRVQ